MKKNNKLKYIVGGAALGAAVLCGGTALADNGYEDDKRPGYTEVVKEKSLGDLVATSVKYTALGVGGLIVGIGALKGFKVVRPTEQGVVERFGKYKRTSKEGLTYVVPFGIEKMYKVPIYEVRVDIEPQEVITKDKLNAIVDAIVYYKVKDTKKK